MQVSFGLCWRILVNFAYLKESVEKCIPSGLVHAEETSFLTKVAYWMIIRLG